MLVKGSPWNGKRVLITGHSGFKGGWLALWLRELGAQVVGFSLPAPTQPSFFAQVGLEQLIDHVEGDVRDRAALELVIEERRPDVIFHLAAQSLVRPSYDSPVETYATNVMGTVNLLDCCRRADGVRAVVCVTSDKCYENREWVWPYRETDPMGGHDPYSSSKGAAEIAIASFRRSYFEDGPLVASVRAGNVIGGGDWSEDRLVPDVVRALAGGSRPVIRAPRAIRPWQHVLDALGGYLMVAERLIDGDAAAATGWNFGPSSEDTRSVADVVDRLIALWGDGEWVTPDAIQPHEANVLKLDSAKARSQLGWRPAMDLDDALAAVVAWYKGVGDGGDALELSLAQLRAHVNDGVSGRVESAR
jgi:CDP-glucose 4,6-dehydratase